MWQRFNGGTMKLLAIVGVVLTTLFVLILLNWIADMLLDPNPGALSKGFVTLFTLLVGGGAGIKYVGGHEVKKKDADG
jgi:apolipoprotein N-acyltransferase